MGKLLKYLKVMLVATFSVTFVSCGGDDDDEPDYNPPITSSLTAPTGVSGTVVTNGVRLSWNPVDVAEFYTISRSNSKNGTTVSLGYIGDSGKIYNTNVIDTKPLEGDNYYYIYACNNLRGNTYSISSKSSPIYVQYIGSNSGGGNDNPGGSGNDNQGGDNNQQKPQAPTGVTVSNEGNNYIPDVRVRWNSVNNATTYYIYKSSSANGSYSKIGETSYAQYGYSDSNAPTNGATAYYKVKAVNSAGESPFSDYAKYTATSNDEAFAPAYTYGNCTVSGSTMTLNWKNSTGNGYGKATEIVLRVWNPYAEEWQDTKLNATATSASFNYSTKIDNSGYVKAGIVVSNAKGSFTAGAKIYDTKNKKWLN
ncbi:MAG: fibronectin type III domain-containing protein [Muribaculaceae bacterium]|nr:fibronectin type III domain-containing protein [Muribaculaceae bacterium]